MSGTVCFFSAIESQGHFDACIDAGVDRMLASFYSLRSRDPDLLMKRHKLYPRLKFMIDSGAHTFITDWEKFKSWKRDDFEKYVQAYVAWIRRNKKLIFCAVELDIDYCLNMVLTGNENSTVGTAIVEGWQKRYFQPLEKEGIQIVYVWHEQRQLQGWEEMCQKFQYVGLPGVFSKQSNFWQFKNIANKYSAKIHGFAATKQIDYSEAGWYSVDSTTWKSGEMYGVFIDWDEKAEYLLFIPNTEKHKRRNYKDKMIALGLDADAIINDTDYKECTKWNLSQCEAVHQFYRKKFKDRRFPYDLRLPHLEVIERMSPMSVAQWVNKIGFDSKFAKHAHHDRKQKLKYLSYISAVQNARYAWLRSHKESLDFLSEYFPGLCAPLISDMSVFQKELSVFMMPRQQVALQRSILPVEEHINAPKQRPVVNYELEDLVQEPITDEIVKML